GPGAGVAGGRDQAEREAAGPPVHGELPRRVGRGEGPAAGRRPESGVRSLSAAGVGTTRPPPTRRTFALFVLGVVAFTVYGSLVPFEFRSRGAGEAADSFLWAMTRRAVPQSRSDALANVLLGVPLGFGLLGLARVDRPGKA